MIDKKLSQELESSHELHTGFAMLKTYLDNL